MGGSVDIFCCFRIFGSDRFRDRKIQTYNRGVKEYFYKKIRRVYIPVILYICFCKVILNPDFLDRWVVVRQFIFLHIGEFRAPMLWVRHGLFFP